MSRGWMRKWMSMLEPEPEPDLVRESEGWVGRMRRRACAAVSKGR